MTNRANPIREEGKMSRELEHVFIQLTMFVRCFSQSLPSQRGKEKFKPMRELVRFKAY